MKIHIIGTVNGLTNEGMRNVATHLARGFETHHTVVYSGLRDIAALWANSRRSDVTLVFARANRQVYWLMRVVERLCKNTWLVCVQKPMDNFLALNRKRPLRCGYLYLAQEDMQAVKLAAGYEKHAFAPGIDTQKFVPVDTARQMALKEKYGFAPDRPVVVHVGHCSAGRGLEAFFSLDREKYQRMVVASGMFEDEATVAALEADGVKIHCGYLEHIEQIYQLADIYLFPTVSTEYVISIPLSVMEALACGTPVMGFKAFGNWQQIAAAKDAVTLVSTAEELGGAADALALRKGEERLLHSPQTWQAAADGILDVIRSTMR